MHYFSIDQAGKIEETNKDTILALYSNEIQYSIKIPKKIKQELFNQCKKRHRKKIMLRMFFFGLFLLLKDKIQENSTIIIDNEYPGHEKNIKQLLLKFLKIKKEHIRFDSIGKKDPSHNIANKTFSGKLKPNEIITEKLLNLNRIIPKKKLKKFLK